MRKSEEHSLATELESFYPPRSLEEICRQLCGGIQEGHFPELMASELVKGLGKKRLCESVTSAVPAALLPAAAEALCWRECGREVYRAMEAGAPLLARFFRQQDDATWTIPPLTAGLFAETKALRQLPRRREQTEMPSGELYSMEGELPRVLDAAAVPESAQLELPAQLPDRDEWKRRLLLLTRELFPEPAREACSQEEAAAILRSFLAGRSGMAWSALLLPHLSERPHPRPPERKEAETAAALGGLLGKLPLKGWTAMEDFLAAAVCLDELKGYLDPDYAADYLYFESRSSYSNYLGDSGTRAEQRYLDTPRLYRDVCLKPLAAGFIGLCALTGLVEIIYREPAAGLSSWEGCAALRLTGWGAYLGGRRAAAPAWRTRRPIRLSGAGEIAFLGEPSLRAESLLRRIGREISPVAFRITRAGIFSSLEDPAGLPRLVRELKEQAEEPLPESWEKFFSGLEEAVLRIEALPDTLVFRLPDNRELLNLLREDAGFRQLILRAEGRRIVIAAADLKKFRQRLTESGYLPEIC
jgi:hypothetical protein